MNLNIEKPIAFFDLETTGVNVSQDRIVEISILKIAPDGSKESFTKRVNPTIPIPIETSEIHGIYDIDVENEYTFKEIADQVLEFIGDADLAGFNSNRFDIPVLVEEFLRAKKTFSVQNRRMIDVQNIFHKMEQRTLEAAYQFYCDKTLVNAHSAEADTKATFEVLDAQIGRYKDLESNAEFLAEFSRQGKFKLLDFAGRIAEDENKVPVFNFGKYKGQSVEKVLEKDSGYYGWMLKNEFPLYTKQVLKELKESFNKKKV